MRRGLVLVGALAWVGCLGTGETIDGVFLPDQWAKLQQQLAVPEALRVPPDPTPFVTFGHDLFNEPGLSNSDVSCPPFVALGGDRLVDPGLSNRGTVSCATCHSGPAMIDMRAANNVSLGDGKYTRRNAMSVLNANVKAGLAAGDIFTSEGAFLRGTQVVHLPSAGLVADLAVTGPMASSHCAVANVVRAKYASDYVNAVGTALSSDDEVVFADVEHAFDAYLRQLVKVDSCFDRYLAGDDDAISASAARGFAVFAGHGTCIDCHSGSMFSDFEFHITGAPQVGPNVPVTDPGRGEVTNASDDGGFLTSSLRNIALTAPYMHDGSLATLADVIAFYRAGGDPTSDYATTRDPRIAPLDISDDDAVDLEAFLDSLTDVTLLTAGTCP